MVMASGRWLGVRLDILSSFLIGSVALAAVLVSQDAGRVYLCTLRLLFLANFHAKISY